MTRANTQRPADVGLALVPVATLQQAALAAATELLPLFCFFILSS